jgi:hypothetical protein
MEDALWDQPCSRFLEERYHGLFDCSSMPERDYAAFMQWLFANGFEACAQSHRGLVRAVWADLPARHWKPTKAAKWRPEEGTIQRFCIKCPWGLPVEGCKYVHGDVIHRVNFPCKFALTCKGTKRTQCLHMHPDETWTPELVIRRPGALVPEPLVPVGFPMTGPPMVAPVVPVAVPVMASMASGGSQASVEPEEAYEGAWDAEDFVEPEVKVIHVTAEEMELEERNKRNRAIQAGHDLTSASASALALADSILAQDKAATAAADRPAPPPARAGGGAGGGDGGGATATRSSSLQSTGASVPARKSAIACAAPRARRARAGAGETCERQRAAHTHS